MAVKYYLGIQSYANHDCGASIVKFNTKSKKIDYVCISEERLIRKKYPYTFPIHSINYCMEYFHCRLHIYLLQQHSTRNLHTY